MTFGPRAISSTSVVLPRALGITRSVTLRRRIWPAGMLRVMHRFPLSSSLRFGALTQRPTGPEATSPVLRVRKRSLACFFFGFTVTALGAWMPRSGSPTEPETVTVTESETSASPSETVTSAS